MPSLEVWANLFQLSKNNSSVLIYQRKIFNFDIFYRGSVKAAFQSAPRKYQVDAAAIRLNSSDCSNEVEDDMLPWLPEDFAEDTIVTIQWSTEKKASSFY